MTELNATLAWVNAILWHDVVLFAIVGTGIVFTVWSGFCQYWALRHGPTVVRGRYDDAADPGALNHYQALATALSATVGLGNIGGVALAIALGGPGAVFWMWVVGVLGMAIKLTEVTLAMLYRNTDDPDNPHGGPMWVAERALARKGYPRLGRTIGVVFCVSLLISTATGGNMFQAWNVGEITQAYFRVPSWICGIVLAVIVGAVIIGGIRRIGRFAGTVVPLMVGAYLLAGLWVLAFHAAEIPGLFVLIVTSAFTPAEAAGAFLGGTAGSAFLFGMKRAIFSNEAGQGSSPIVHAAARTDEPVREGVVAGLEPFIDTLVVCTFTALIILVTGIWNRAPDLPFPAPPAFAETGAGWQLPDMNLPGSDWHVGDSVSIVVRGGPNPVSGNDLHRLSGTVIPAAAGDTEAVRDEPAAADGAAPVPGYVVRWTAATGERPVLVSDGIYRDYVGATLTAKAFDSVTPGLGKWVITVAVWLFALSTMISWAYYGEQAVVFIGGERPVLAYKLVYCALIVVATLGLVRNAAALDNVIGTGTGIVVCANLPIIWLFGREAMVAYRDYIARLKDGRIGADPKMQERR
ncbi:MAG TPA: amino acid carrier protein [Woeseiaceae bacterium]|nr:amino acid carrier protein [Woeseiaceae bacterium]